MYNRIGDIGCLRKFASNGGATEGRIGFRNCPSNCLILKIKF